MQPNEQPTHPIDYLDSISTAPKKTTGGPADKLFFGILGLGVLVVLLVGALMVFGGGASQKSDLSTLSVRLKNLQSVADGAKRNITSSSLRAVNTNLSLALTNANRDIGDSLFESGIETGKIDPKITARESTDELNERLNDARLNAIFDRTYAREMTYQIDTTLILLETLEGKTKNKIQKEFLSATHKNLAPLKEQFSSFDAASS